MMDAKTHRIQATNARQSAEERRRAVQTESQRAAQYSKDGDFAKAKASQDLMQRQENEAMQYEKTAVVHEAAALKLEAEAKALVEQQQRLQREYDQKLKDLDQQRQQLLGTP